MASNKRVLTGPDYGWAEEGAVEYPFTLGVEDMAPA